MTGYAAWNTTAVLRRLGAVSRGSPRIQQRLNGEAGDNLDGGASH